MKLLVCNAGSTSLKFKLFEMPQEKLLCYAKVERVGSRDAAMFSYVNSRTGEEIYRESLSIPDYNTGIQLFLEAMLSPKVGVIDSLKQIERVGFKTVAAKGCPGVHELTEAVMQGMKDYLYIAPVHNAAYISAIEQFKTLLPDTIMIGAFETAFHRTIPLERSIYSIPYEWYEQYGIKKLAYHGASHEYISSQTKNYGQNRKVISCHLGGSCSICAIQDGKSVDSSFGFSLQTGVMHANRAGDIDPYIIPFLMDQGMSIEQVLDGLSRRGGLLGISGVSNDFRVVYQASVDGDERAKLALDVFVCEIVRYIGMFFAEMGGMDQLVFTGGIGEHSAELRYMVCGALENMGIKIDESKNRETAEGIISAKDSMVKILVIPTNEELGVARKTYEYKII